MSEEELEYIGFEPYEGDGGVEYYKVKGKNIYVAKEMQEGEVVEERRKRLQVFYPF